MRLKVIKKLIVLVLIIVCTGCTMYQIDRMSYENIINTVVNNNVDVHNTNNKGYRYYLPTGFSIYSDNDFNSILLNNQNYYYLYVDAVSFYKKTDIICNNKENSVYYYAFDINDKKGYLNIFKNNDYFYVEMMYNYAIIEVKIDEIDINSAIVYGGTILSSIKYNTSVIEKLIEDNVLETKITKYEIFGPEKKDNKNYLELYDSNNESEMEE